ncbi:hypothetical protein [Bartonella acomydis]|uniref:Phage related protein n=1 Tax=Bartonella acomydis TaxID=686234 RepID=A0ABP9MIE6_9HYPH
MGEAIIVIGGIFIAGSIIYNLWLADHQEKQLSKQFEQLCGREIVIYQNIIAQEEQRLFQKTRRIPKEWIKKWNQEVRHWERGVLEIKSPKQWPPSKSSGPWPLMVKDICMQGYGNA